MITTQAAVFEQLWSAIADIGRDPVTDGYRRFAWTEADLSMRDWFTSECASRGLDLMDDRMGNQWGWWGNPDSSVAGGVVTAPIWTACRTAALSTAPSAW